MYCSARVLKLAVTIFLVLSVFLAGLFLPFLAPPANAANGVLKQINFQGKIVNKTTLTNIADATYSFTFSLYDAAAAGTQKWTETKNLTTVDGVFQTYLGDTSALPNNADFNTDALYLDITFNGEAFGTRIRLSAAAYALNADQLNGLTVTYATNNLTLTHKAAGATGNSITVIPITPTGTSAGGDLNLTGGTALTTGAGGAVAITGGTAAGLNQNGGTLTLNSGAVTGSGTSTINIGTSNTTAISVGSSALVSPIAITSGSAAASTNAITLTANSLTSGKALAVTSSATAFTGNMISATLSGNNAANSGTLLTLTNSGALNTGALITLAQSGTGNDITGTGGLWSVTKAGVLTVASCTGCGGAGSSALSAITAATGPATIGSGDNAVAWNWTLTTAAKTAFTFGETAAATNGAGNQSLVDITTASASTASPLRVTSSGTADTIVNLASTGDFIIQDAATPFAQFLDDGTITLGKASVASAINIGSGTGGNTINIAGTGATGADTINIGTGGTSADTITIGNNASTTALNLTSGTGSQTFTSSVISGTTTTSAFVMRDSALTTGTLLYLSAANITSGKFLDISNSSSVFSVSYTDFTTSLPTNFNAAGDVAVAYDINFTNPTASFIKSAAPITIQSGETFNNSNLTLKTYNLGSVVVDSSQSTANAVDVQAQSLTTGIALNINGNTGGTFIKSSFSAAKTQAAALTGLNADFSTNLTAAAGSNILGATVALPALTQTAASTTTTYTGYNISTVGAMQVNQATASVVNWNGANITLPAITAGASGGTITADGLKVTVPASAAVVQTAGTATMNGFEIIAPTTSGPASGTLNGIKIGALTSAGAGAETGLLIGSGWDNAISINSGGLTLNSAAVAANAALTVSTSTGNIIIQAAGSGTAANVQIGAGNGGAGSTTPDILVLDGKSSAGNPTAVNGGIYYNVSSHELMCGENSAWTHCTGWQFLGRAALGGAAATVGPVALTSARKHLMIRLWVSGYASTGIASLQLGGAAIDTGANYASAILEGATLNNTSVSVTGIRCAVTMTTGVRYMEFHVDTWATGNAKRVIGWANSISAAANTAPTLSSCGGIWVDTTNSIQRVQFTAFNALTGTTTVNLNANTEFEVWGRDDD